MGIRKFLRRFRLKSVQAGEGQRSVDNVDAMAATEHGARTDPQGVLPGTVPPGYIKSYDEGRPSK
jgi:hypothetical protein